jgi:HAD superfamily 5'-nucleotidase-like hydrolase
LKQLYSNSKEACSSQSYDSKINPKGVFANNELDLSEIEIYGFDYDYTLAYYNSNIFGLLFNLARDILIDKYKYPKELECLGYTDSFPIRGLHFDKRNGWFMKIDSYHNIQLGTVYYGMNQVSDEDVKKFYNGTHVRIDDIGYTQTSSTMHHFIDLFCLPEMHLIASIIDYFIKHSVQFSPDYIFNDVSEAISSIHRNQYLHQAISKSIREYILPGDQDDSFEACEKLREFLLRLKKAGKNTFLITNSKYWFVNIGMNILCGQNWQQLFDVIVCQARKPLFFTSNAKPFREYIHGKDLIDIKTWKTINKFEPNRIYIEGNLFQLLEFTHWSNKKILYFGDNLYSDLVQPFLKYGWRNLKNLFKTLISH